ncbi:MAG: hypothetical protein HS103_06460 [Anaerolineales bacterium]|nr:hypothetical protein [Anaerolineales bacterium]
MKKKLFSLFLFIIIHFTFNGRTAHIKGQLLDYITVIKISSTGQFVATALSNNQLQIRKVSTTNIVRTLTGHIANLSVLAWNSDDSRLAVGSSRYNETTTHAESIVYICRTFACKANC